jgi:simple sugar transport system permease protein
MAHVPIEMSDDLSGGSADSLALVRRGAQFLLRKPESTIAVAGAVLIVYFSLANQAFLSAANIRIVSQFAIPMAILAVGQTMLLICGEIDLSMGAVYFMTPFLVYSRWRPGWRCPSP